MAQEIIDHAGPPAAFGPDALRLSPRRSAPAPSRPSSARSAPASRSTEWAGVLASRGDEALADPRPALGVLALGLGGALAAGRENVPRWRCTWPNAAGAAAANISPIRLPAWAAVRDLGEAYLALDRPEEAILTLEPLLIDAGARSPAARDLCADATRCPGRPTARLGDTTVALTHLRIAFEARAGRSPQGADLRDDCQRSSLDLGEPADAVETLRAGAAAGRTATSIPNVAARVLTTLAHTLGGLNRYAEAIDVYEEALVVLRDVARRQPDAHRRRAALAGARRTRRRASCAEAARVYRRALNLLERADAPRQSRDILHQLARVTAAMGDQSAVQLYEQTRDETDKWGTCPGTGPGLLRTGRRPPRRRAADAGRAELSGRALAPTRADFRPRADQYAAQPGPRLCPDGALRRRARPSGPKRSTSRTICRTSRRSKSA